MLEEDMYFYDYSDRNVGWAVNPELLESLDEFKTQIDYDAIVHAFKRKVKNVAEFISPKHLRKRFKARWFGITVTKEQEQNGGELLEQIDADDVADAEEVGLPLNPQNPRNRFAFVASLVAECKCEIPGLDIETKANRLVVRRWLNNRMTERKMRPTHIRAMLPLAVESVFIPDKYEIEARALRQSRAVQDRVQLGNDVLYSRTDPWLLNWLGTRRRRPDAGGD